MQVNLRAGDMSLNLNPSKALAVNEPLASQVLIRRRKAFEMDQTDLSRGKPVLEKGHEDSTPLTETISPMPTP